MTKGQPQTQATLGAEVGQLGWRGRAYALGRGVGVMTSLGTHHVPRCYGVWF